MSRDLKLLTRKLEIKLSRQGQNKGADQSACLVVQLIRTFVLHMQISKFSQGMVCLSHVMKNPVHIMVCLITGV